MISKRNNSNNKILFFIIILFANFFTTTLYAKQINIVAAENFYGDIAKQIGGPYVTVISILNNPSQDPHLFSASPSTAKAIANADIVVYNGAGYDSWMERLITAKQNKTQQIVIANLVNKQLTGNPHLWYAPETMPRYAKELASLLTQQDPEHQDYYSQQLKLFNQNYQLLLNKINQLKQRYQGIAIIATEPLFNDMADALRMDMHAEKFQMMIMNDSTPTPSQISAFEQDLKTHAVNVLIYNKQVSNPTTERMQDIAKEAGIPTIGVSETQPSNKTYVEWMSDQLSDLEKALNKERNNNFDH